MHHGIENEEAKQTKAKATAKRKKKLHRINNSNGFCTVIRFGRQYLYTVNANVKSEL